MTMYKDEIGFQIWDKDDLDGLYVKIHVGDNGHVLAVPRKCFDGVRAAMDRYEAKSTVLGTPAQVRKIPRVVYLAPPEGFPSMLWMKRYLEADIYVCLDLYESKVPYARFKVSRTIDVDIPFETSSSRLILMKKIKEEDRSTEMVEVEEWNQRILSRLCNAYKLSPVASKNSDAWDYVNACMSNAQGQLFVDWCQECMIRFHSVLIRNGFRKWPRWKCESVIKAKTNDWENRIRMRPKKIWSDRLSELVRAVDGTKTVSMIQDDEYKTSVDRMSFVEAWIMYGIDWLTEQLDLKCDWMSI